MPMKCPDLKVKMSIGLKPIAAVAGLILVQACTGMTSVEIGAEGDTNLGPSYYLPTTVIPLTVEIYESTGRITVAASEPVYVPDMAAGEFRLNSIYSEMHAEDVAVTTTASGLLTNIEYISDARTDEALVNLAKSAGTILQPETRLQKKIVFKSSIDLAALVVEDEATAAGSELGKLNANINRALRHALQGQSSGFLGAAACESGPVVTLSVRGPVLPPDTRDERDKCRIGFCYRRAVPYVVSATFFDGSIAETTVEVPNGAPIRAAALNRGVLTKWTSIMALSNGMLTKHQYVTDASPVERIALLPFELVGAAVAGLTQQGKLWNAASSRLDSEVKYRENQANARENPQPEARLPRRLFELSAGDASQNRIEQPPLNNSSGTNNSSAVDGPSGRSTSGNPGLGR